MSELQQFPVSLRVFVLTLRDFWTERWKLGALVFGGWLVFCSFVGVFTIATATTSHPRVSDTFDSAEREEIRRKLFVEAWNANRGSPKAKDLVDRLVKEMDLQDEGPELVTKENYNRVYPGMGIDKVNGILGLKGDLQSQISDHRTYVFKTRRGWGNIILTFDDTRLISKHSFGL